MVTAIGSEAEVDEGRRLTVLVDPNAYVRDVRVRRSARETLTVTERHCLALAA